MATTKNARNQANAGPPSIKSRWLHFDEPDGDGMHMPANMFASLFEKNMAPIIGGPCPYTVSVSAVDGWAITTGGTADAITAATTGGFLMTAASDDNFDMTLDSVLTFTPTSGKWYGMMARIAVSDATGIGFRLGITTGAGVAALPFGTDYTDQVTISKAITSASVLGKCRGNSGTAADSATLGTIVAATEVEVGFCVFMHATTPAGYFAYKTSTADTPTFTAMSSDQLAQVAAILTTPPGMFYTIHITGVTGTNPTLSVTSFIAGGDR